MITYCWSAKGIRSLWWNCLFASRTFLQPLASKPMSTKVLCILEDLTLPLSRIFLTCYTIYKGCLPFRYLGVPLSTKRLLIWQNYQRAALSWEDDCNGWSLMWIEGRLWQLLLLVVCILYDRRRMQDFSNARERDPESVTRMIVQETVERESLKPKLASRIHALNFYPGVIGIA